MSVKKMVECDTNKLYPLLKQRGLKPSQVSRDIGFGSDYLANAVQRKRISESAALLLDKLYNIKADEYTFDKEEPKKQEVKQENLESKHLGDMTDKELYRLIYSACYHGVKKALESN